MATSRAVRVGVVGAGVAGLQAMRALRHTGAEVIAFEKAQGPGGLWRSNYAGFGIQVPKELYEAAVGIFADGPTVQRYIERYTRDALQSGNNPPATVEYETEIVKLAPRHDGKPGFDMHVRKGSDVRIETVDKAVVSTGMYSSFPTMPDLDGRSAFEEAGGQVVHSSEVTDAETMRSKDVIVVGAGKSAIDLALQAKKVTARAPTMLMRHGAHWAAPTHIAGLIPFQYVFLSRFGQALVALYKGVWPGGPKSLSIAHTLLAPVMRPVFAIVEALFKFQFGFKDDYVPPEDVDIVTDFYGYAHVLDSDFKKALGKDEVVAVQGEIARLHPGEAELRDGRRVPCDLVVCATGFGKDYSFLDEAVRSKLDIADDGHWLYRHTLPPKCPELAFCGAELATISNIGTYALQAEWIARLWSGKMRLPDQTEMLKDVEATKEWKRQWMPNAGSRANMILLHQTHFHDSLLTDMGLERKRKPNLLLECLEPYRPRDYDAVPCSS